MKKCKTCEIDKPLIEFWAHARSKDGFQYSCKECQKLIRAEYGREKRAFRAQELRRNREDLIRSTQKTCRTCSRTLPKSMFNRAPSNVDNRTHKCKDCLAIWHKEHRLLPEVRDSMREKDRVRRYAKYGTSIEEVEARLSATNNSCEICGSSFETANMHVDHFHDIGGLRGVLCDYCNKGIGSFRESAELVIAAGEYMKRAYNLS